MKHKGYVLEKGIKITWKIGTILWGSQLNIFKHHNEEKLSVYQKLLSNH